MTESSHEMSVHTTGRTIQHARLYDLGGTLFSLGRAGKMRDQTIALARIVAGEDVLDVGCGTGEIAMRARVHTGSRGSVTGIDPSPEMIAMARQKAIAAGMEIDYRVAAVEALPFAGATFDVVISNLMMHHLPEDLKPRAVAEMRRVLKPGGRIVIVDLQRPDSLLGRLTPIWLIHSREDVDGLARLPSLLRDVGFIDIETAETGFSYLGCVRARVAD